MECGSYRGIKLLEHAIKVVERIFEHKIWQQVEIDDMQYGFMKGKGTTNAIFIVRQTQERCKKRKWDGTSEGRDENGQVDVWREVEI